MARGCARKKPGSFHEREQLVHIVGRRGAGARVDALPQVGVVEQADLAVVDHLVLLPLAQRLDGQPELLLGLVHRLVVEVGDAGVHLQHGLRDASARTRGAQLVVDERAGQLGSPWCPAESSIAASPALSWGFFGAVLEGLEVAAGAPRSGRRPPRRRPSAARARWSRWTALTVNSQVVRRFEVHLVGEVIAVGEHVPRTAGSPYLPLADLARPCRGR
jgi:hypothetical protein